MFVTLSGRTDEADLVSKALQNTDQLMAVVDLATLRFVAVSPALEALWPDQTLVGMDVRTLLVGGASVVLPLFVEGQLEGYELTRRIRLPAEIRDAYVWVHALGDERPPRSAVVVAHVGDRGNPSGYQLDTSEWAVIGVVDEEWRIHRIGSDVSDALGYSAASLHGRSILGLIHPGDLAEFLLGLSHAERSGAGVAVRLRLRTAQAAWQWARIKLSPVGEGAGFAFVFGSLSDPSPSRGRADELERRLARIAHEVHLASVARRSVAAPVSVEVPSLASLTNREWEVVTRVRAGDNVSEIARAIHLSPSTVRNHLSAAYRKLRVRSLAEMLLAFDRHARPPTRDDSG